MDSMWTRFRCDPDSHLDPNYMEFYAGRDLNHFGLDDFSPALKALALENMYASTPKHILEGPGPPAKQRSRWLAGKGSGPRSSRRSTASLQDLVCISIYYCCAPWSAPPWFYFVKSTFLAKVLISPRQNDYHKIRSFCCCGF